MYCLGFAGVGRRLWLLPVLYSSPLVDSLVLILVVGVGSCLLPVLANLNPSRRTVVRGWEVERLIGCEVELENVGDFGSGVSSFVVRIFRFSGTWCLLSV